MGLASSRAKRGSEKRQSEVQFYFAIPREEEKKVKKSMQEVKFDWQKLQFLTHWSIANGERKRERKEQKVGKNEKEQRNGSQNSLKERIRVKQSATSETCFFPLLHLFSSPSLRRLTRFPRVNIFSV